MDAVSSRDFAAEAASCAALAMIDASRLAEELILWSTKEFGFVEFADEYSASSSIMPQKKNPVTAEVVRAKSGSVLGSLVSIHTILKALPYTYNLDLQELTPHLWHAFDDAISSVSVLAGSMRSMKVNTKAMQASMVGDTSTAVGLANHLVAKEGFSFRQAHAVVGELVRLSIEKGITLPRAVAKYLPRVSSKSGRRLKINEGMAEKILDPKAFLSSIATQGGSNPSSVPSGVAQRRRELSSNLKIISTRRNSLSASQRKLNRKAKGLSREVKTKI
jgi:argininosuccinate lyase